MTNVNQAPLPRLSKAPLVRASLVERRYIKYLAFFMVCLQCNNCVIHIWAVQRWASHKSICLSFSLDDHLCCLQRQCRLICPLLQRRVVTRTATTWHRRSSILTAISTLIRELSRTHWHRGSGRWRPLLQVSSVQWLTLTNSRKIAVEMRFFVFYLEIGNF